MPISYFRVLQLVLSQTRDVICKTLNISEEQAFKKAEEFIKENSARWRLPNPDVQYADPFCRIAYLYMNVAIHANLIDIAMTRFPELYALIGSKIAKEEETRICALGGGPGSELLGVVKHIQNKKRKLSKVAYLDFILVDQIREWDESWHALKRGVDEYFKNEYGKDRSNWPVIISKSFLPLSITSLSDFQNFATRFNDTDVFICCYLISELNNSLENLKTTLNLLMQRVSPGALILFIDRDQAIVRNSIKEAIVNNSSLEFVSEFKDRGRLDGDMKELGEWYINIPSLPRRSWLTYFALAKRK